MHIGHDELLRQLMLKTLLLSSVFQPLQANLITVEQDRLGPRSIHSLLAAGPPTPNTCPPGGEDIHGTVRTSIRDDMENTAYTPRWNHRALQHPNKVKEVGESN